MIIKYVVIYDDTVSCAFPSRPGETFGCPSALPGITNVPSWRPVAIEIIPVWTATPIIPVVVTISRDTGSDGGCG